MATLHKTVMTGLPELNCSKQDYGEAEGSISVRTVFVYLQQTTE